MCFYNIDEPMLKNLCLHSHNFFCDGSDHPEIYLHKAVNLNFTQYGFSSHAPLKYATKWAMPIEKLDEYNDFINSLKEKYKDKITVLKSLEMDYVPDDSYDFEFFNQKLSLDYMIGSIHLVKNPLNGMIWFIDGPQSGFDRGIEKVFNGDVQAAITQYFQQSIDMIKLHKPDIIGHMDKVLMNNADRHFTSDDAWYRKEITALLECIKEHNTIIEINTRGLYQGRWKDTYPGKYLWSAIKEMDIPIVMSSDAHKPQDIDGFYAEVHQDLLNHGFTHQMMWSPDGWKATEL